MIGLHLIAAVHLLAYIKDDVGFWINLRYYVQYLVFKDILTNKKPVVSIFRINLAYNKNTIIIDSNLANNKNTIILRINQANNKNTIIIGTSSLF